MALVIGVVHDAPCLGNALDFVDQGNDRNSTTLYYLTRLSDDRFDELLEEGVIRPDMKRNEASAETRKESKAKDEKRILSLKPIAEKFPTLVVDPPWDYEWLSLAGRATPGYATMTHEELLALDLGQWVDESSGGAHLRCTRPGMTEPT